jgi:hypothetical protein
MDGVSDDSSLSSNGSEDFPDEFDYPSTPRPLSPAFLSVSSQLSHSNSQNNNNNISSLPSNDTSLVQNISQISTAQKVQELYEGSLLTFSDFF